MDSSSILEELSRLLETTSYCTKCAQRLDHSKFYQSCPTVCKDCVRKRSRCVHDKVRSQCRSCNGSAFCVHDKRKAICKECKGSQICVHNRQKAYCRLCKGSRICEHGNQKAFCKQCKGTQICVHGRQRTFCKDCIDANLQADNAS